MITVELIQVYLYNILYNTNCMFQCAFQCGSILLLVRDECVKAIYYNRIATLQ